MAREIACCMGLLFMGIFFGIGTLISAIHYIQYTEYNTIPCTVTYTTYPQDLPNKTNQDDFIKCDCGYNCFTKGYCVKIFVKTEVNETNTSSVMAMRSTSDNTRYMDDCTFYESQCRNGESIEDRYKAIENAKNIALEYPIGKNMTCYTDNNEDIFLERDYSMATFIAMVVGIFVTLFCCFFMFAECPKKNKEKNNQDSYMI